MRRSLTDLPPGKVNREAVDRLTDEDIDRQIAADPDVPAVANAEWFKNARVVFHKKEHVSIRLDAEVLAYFRETGPLYQTRINEVLRAYVDAHKKSA